MFLFFSLLFSVFLLALDSVAVVGVVQEELARRKKSGEEEDDGGISNNSED